MYLVSCLIPVFNTEKYIERCARSLFNQTYSNLEFVFVDDCSPDRSIDILESVMEDYPSRETSIRIIHHDTNKGLASTRNTLLNHAAGDFVCHIDSDDWLEPQAIELLVKRQIETNADIVSGNAYMYTPKGVEELVEPIYRSKDEMVFQQLQYTLDHVIWRRIIRRSLYVKNHIQCLSGCDMAEDRYQMALLSYFANSFASVDGFIYNYERRNEGSIMSQYENPGKMLRKQNEYLGNWLGIYRFFCDKEELFHCESARQTIIYAKNYLKKSLRCRSKQDFLNAINSIDQIEGSFWPIIGWQKRGLKGFLLHNYFYMEAVSLRDRICRYINRRINKRYVNV